MDEEKDILHNIHENVKKSEFKDYEALRKYLIDNPVRSVVYDDRMEMRPSCLKRLDKYLEMKDDLSAYYEWFYSQCEYKKR